MVEICVIVIFGDGIGLDIMSVIICVFDVFDCGFIYDYVIVG